MSAPRAAVSVVVPTRDRPDHLRECLQSLALAVGPDDEVVVADSASRDAEAVAAVAHQAGARLVRVEAPGASRARNAGWRHSAHPVVLFTDDDCRARPGWADAYARRLADEPAAIVAWGPVTVSVGGTGTADMGVDGPARARHGDDVGLLGGAGNLAVRRSALEQVGGFDELLGAGTLLRASEDKDLLLRLLAAGGEGVLEPAAVVDHVVWRSRLAAVRVQHHYGIGQGVLAAKARRMGVRPEASFPDGLLRTPLRQVLSAARNGYKTGVLTGLARAGGVVRGRAGMRGLSVVDGHLRVD